MVAEVNAVVIVNTCELPIRHLDSASCPRIHLTHFDALVPVLSSVVEKVSLNHCVMSIHYIRIEHFPFVPPFVSSHCGTTHNSRLDLPVIQKWVQTLDRHVFGIVYKS